MTNTPATSTTVDISTSRFHRTSTTAATPAALPALFRAKTIDPLGYLSALDVLNRLRAGYSLEWVQRTLPVEFHLFLSIHERAQTACRCRCCQQPQWENRMETQHHA